MTAKQKQHLLGYLGYYAGEIDGAWGEMSQAATRAFQRDYGLTADGIFGIGTEARIREVVASGEMPRHTQDVPETGGADWWKDIRYFKRAEFRCPCGRCGGKGRIIKTPCTACRGSGLERKRRTIQAKIPAGIDNGQTISIRGQGHAGKNGGPSGDLLITITVRPHELFRREGTSVLCEAPITFAQAVLGAELEIPTIDGKVKYDLPEGTQSGTTFRLKGKGIPELNGRGRGDQYVTVYIETPRNLNREQKEALKKFAESVGDNNYEERKKFFKKFKK